LLLAVCCALSACQSRKSPETAASPPDSAKTRFPAGTFGHAVEFLNARRKALVLTAPDTDSARVVVVPSLQGRVMTSTAGGPGGRSYGWMNFNLLETNQYQPHINPYGGEERLWLAPEGGAFSIYFKPGEPFDFAHWQTPPLIDTVAFAVKEATRTRAVFTKTATLTNYSGVPLTVEITRTVRMLSRDDVRKNLNVRFKKGVKLVAYESENVLRNRGENWRNDRGLLAVWILGMFNAGPNATIAVPVQPDATGRVTLTDDYFGKIPADRLKTKGNTVFFKADGQARGKIGVGPGSTRGVAGSYDGSVLTLIQFDVNPTGAYLKSAWKREKNPFGGDAFNSYNDGLNAEGKQMGTLYELESTSEARPLKTGERLVHHHRTFHFEGQRADLDAIAKAVLGVGLAGMEGGLK
jgi:hypothetical protein